MVPYGPGGVRQAEHTFGNPGSILRQYGDRMLYYVQKPSVLTLSQRMRAELMIADRAHPAHEPDEPVEERAHERRHQCVIT